MDYSGYCNVALRKVALSGRSFDGVGSGSNVYFLTRVSGLTSSARKPDYVVYNV